MGNDISMADVIRQVRKAAANEAERLLVQAAGQVKASPARLGAVEKNVRDGVFSIGATVLGGAIRLSGTGYIGSRKMCGCGETQKYINDRERRVVSLLGEFRFKRAYYWCATCGESDAPMDRALTIERSDFSPTVREAVGLLGAEVAFGRGKMLMGELTGICVSKRKHREISEAIGASMMPAEESDAGDTSGGKARAPAQTVARNLPVIGGEIQDLYLSADGTMAPMIDRWREVKIGAVFHGRPGADGEPIRGATRYMGDLVDAESFGWRWYGQAAAMGLERALRVVVIGDGAAWIWNQAEMHFPGAIQIVDWYHATERLWTVANAYFPEGDPHGHEWVETCKKLLRASRVEKVIEKLSRLRTRNKKNAQDDTGSSRVFSKQCRAYALSALQTPGTLHRQRRSRGRMQTHRRPAVQAKRDALESRRASFHLISPPRRPE